MLGLETNSSDLSRRNGEAWETSGRSLKEETVSTASMKEMTNLMADLDSMVSLAMLS